MRCVYKLGARVMHWTAHWTARCILLLSVVGSMTLNLGCSESSFDKIRYESHDVRSISSAPQDQTSLDAVFPETSEASERSGYSERADLTISSGDLTLVKSTDDEHVTWGEVAQESDELERLEQSQEQLLIYETNRRPSGAVRPILECVERLNSGRWRARFGYLNTYDHTRRISIGPYNKFTPSPRNRGQVERFESGRHVDVFQVIFDGESLVWTLGDQRSRRSATASRQGPRCSGDDDDDDGDGDNGGDDDDDSDSEDGDDGGDDGDDDVDDGDDDCGDDPPPQCASEEIVIVSDVQSNANGEPAVLTYDGNPRWTAEIGYGAAWIWDEEVETHPQCDSVVEIERSFMLEAGQQITSAMIRMAGDNAYQCVFNDHLIFGSAIGTSYFNENVLEVDLSVAIREGENTLSCAVTNWGLPRSNGYQNPGGLIFAIVVDVIPPERLCDGIDNDCDGDIDEGDLCEPLLGYHGGFEWVNVPRNSRWEIYEEPDLAGWRVSWLNPDACEHPRAPVLEIQGYGLCTGDEGEIEGHQHAELDSDCQGPGGGRGAERTTVRIERVVPTVPGQRYSVSFYARSRHQASGTQTIYAEWNGRSLIEESTRGSWTEYIFEVIAVDDETTLAFADLGDANTLGVLLDDIEVTPIP